MGETLIAALVVVVLLAVGMAHRFVPWFTMLQGGVWVIIFGTTLSIAAGIVYHLALYRVLEPHAALKPRWWWRPTAFHQALQPHERPVVLPWFYVGAASFMLVMVGCLAVLLAVWRAE